MKNKQLCANAPLSGKVESVSDWWIGRDREYLDFRFFETRNPFLDRNTDLKKNSRLTSLDYPVSWMGRSRCLTV